MDLPNPESSVCFPWAAQGRAEAEQRWELLLCWVRQCGCAGRGSAGQGMCPHRAPTLPCAQPGTGTVHVTLEAKPVPTTAHQEEKEISSSEFSPPAYFLLGFPCLWLRECAVLLSQEMWGAELGIIPGICHFSRARLCLSCVFLGSGAHQALLLHPGPPETWKESWQTWFVEKPAPRSALPGSAITLQPPPVPCQGSALPPAQLLARAVSSLLKFP